MSQADRHVDTAVEGVGAQQDDGTGGLPAEGLRDRMAELAVIKQRAVEGLNEEAAARQHRLGKLTARERIERLLDPGSFTELEVLRRHRATSWRRCVSPLSASSPR